MATNAPLPRSRARIVVPGSLSQFGTGISTYKFGRNADVDAAEDLIITGGNLHVPTAAAATTIESASANDAVAGTGLASVKVSGIDSNWDAIEETVVLTGQTAVTLTNQYLRVFRIRAVTAGSGGSAITTAAGAITVKHGTTTLCTMPAGGTTSQHAAYSVPRGCVGEIVHLDMVAEGSPTLVTTAGVMTRDPSSLLNSWVERSNHYVVNGEHFAFDFPVPIVVPEMNDVKLRVFTVSAANALIRGGFGIRIYKKY
jgi:hypothetical protein